MHDKERVSERKRNIERESELTLKRKILSRPFNNMRSLFSLTQIDMERNSREKN